MRTRKLSTRLALAILALGCSSLPTWGTAPSLGHPEQERSPLAHREAILRRIPVHSAEFTPVATAADLSHCDTGHPPEPLATPDPLLPTAQDALPVRVSFIVGIDGHVYSPFILDGGGPKADPILLRAVGRWRYRPATCNGVPTDFEARVQFRNR
jgi:hypothetical protein